MIQSVILRNNPPFRPNLSFEFREFNLFIGENGSGKSKMLQMFRNPQNNGPEFGITSDTPLDGSHIWFIDEKRFSKHDARYRQIPDDGLGGIPAGFANFDFENENTKQLNKDIENIFGRTISNPVIPRKGRTSAYTKGSDKIPIQEDGLGISNAITIMESIQYMSDKSILLVEEPTLGLNPKLVKPFLDNIIARMSEKEISLITTTQDVVGALYFFNKIKENNFRIYNFHDNDGILDAHPIEEDSITSSLRDFLGDFPSSPDFELLRELNM